MYQSQYLSEAQDAYKKFLKSSKGILGFGLRKEENLKSFSDVQKKENAYNSVNLGVKEIPLSKITGSVEKYKDFDRHFIPKNDTVKQRWINIYIGYMEEKMFPPVVLYKIKDNYYVYDGNHRISVANFLNFASVEAEVQEFLPTGDAEDEIIYREHMYFEKETGIEDIILTEPKKYRYLEDEIRNYAALLNKRGNRNTKFKEVSKIWYREVFLPIRILLKENKIEENIPQGNINDRVLSVLAHKYYINEITGGKTGYLFSTVDFINLFKTSGDRNLNNCFQIVTEKSREMYARLKKTDEEIQESSGNGNRKKMEQIGDMFTEKVMRMPDVYFAYAKKLDNRKLGEYIVEYMDIKSEDGKKKGLYGNRKDVEIAVLNYIIEIFLPVLEIFSKINYPENENLEIFRKKYCKLQRELFSLLYLRDVLISEGKPYKYENIMKNRIRSVSEVGNEKKLYGAIGILINDKEKEFLDNLKNKRRFLDILEKYNGVKKYETYVELFIMLDNYGEEKFLNMLEKHLEEHYSSIEAVNRYKTQSVMDSLDNGSICEEMEPGKEGLEYTFIDFYIKRKSEEGIL